LFAHLLAQSQHGIFDLCQVGPRRLIRPVQQFIDRPDRSASASSFVRNSARVGDMAHLQVRWGNYA
jgi:hypothetical protein